MSKPSGHELLNQIQQSRLEALDFMKALTLCESPSTDPETQPQLRELICDALSDVDYAVIRVPGKSSGGMLYSRPKQKAPGNFAQLMLGHYDTVWPVGTLEKMPLEIEGNIARGPGLYDMKAGITQAVFALKTLKTLGLKPDVEPVIFLNSDEEIGSTESTRHIRRLAPCMDRVFVLEPSMGLDGKIKTSRKAVARYQISVVGKAAHAGLDPEAGASAILELSHVIQKLFALNDPQNGISVNVGTIDGGLRANVVAPMSSAIVDVRTNSQADAEAVEKVILSLKAETPGTTLQITGKIGRPAMEKTARNQALWKLAVKHAENLGLELEQGQAGGGSDGNTTSQFTATLDGMGAVGDGAHAEHEHIDIEQTLERTALLTSLLLAPPLKRKS